MSRFSKHLGWPMLIACAFMTGCAPEQETPSAVQQITPSVSVSATTTPSPTPTAQPTTDGPTTLVVWLPQRLFPVDDETLTAVLEAEVNEFVVAQDNVRIEIRRKTSQDVGGIMSTLRTASSVAPGALPDITLLRREDLLSAVEDGLIQPLEGRIATAVIADLYPSALRLGRADDQLYGLPYVLDLYLYAYRPMTGDPPERWTFDEVVSRDQTLALPAARPNGIADVLWLQYIAAGGSLPVDGEFELTRGAVADVLTFYEHMAQAGLIAPGIEDYAAPQDYAELLSSERIDSGVITTGNLRLLRDAEPLFSYTTVPTSGGLPTTLVDGWMWVIVTPNAERQALSGRFLNWMMDAGRHSTYAQAVAMPPTQRSALRRWSIEGLDNAVLIEMLSDSLPVQPDVGTFSAARSFQAAWLEVLTGRATASVATAAALED